MAKTDIPPLTEQEMASWPKEPLVELSKPFVDVRGNIQPLVDEMMRSAVMIQSKAGSVRANHYHKTDWHYCYIIAGRIEYYHRPTGSDREPELIVAEAGQMIFTPPMVDHVMKYPVDTMFLTLSRNPRDQEAYEADVVRIELIDTDGSLSWTPDEKS